MICKFTLNKTFNEGAEYPLFLDPTDILTIDVSCEQFNGKDLDVTRIRTRKGGCHYIKESPELAGGIWYENLKEQLEAAPRRWMQ